MKLSTADRRTSTDITDRSVYARSPSPAPTYCSTFHATKDRSPEPGRQHTGKSSSSRDSKYTWEDSKSTSYSQDTKSLPCSSKKSTSKLFTPLEEPFDTNHPHYTPPHNAPPPELPPRTRPRAPRSRFPPTKILLPWILFAIFFPITLWYTSIALGVRLYYSLSLPRPPPSTPDIHIIINIPNAADDAVNISTIISIPQPTTTDPTDRLASDPGAQPNPSQGTNTVTSAVEKKVVGTMLPSRFRTKTIKGR
ncbi:hypothetical protein P154DRAFT_622129 [Amniculicola lignicola CBS 123094]|uniref:Uncharacterized protein n=1 Tax=Amniculicola lignicola CBS 123094 TaxID=1392246 RepID=A0A6A5W834_9PLEO|nr:hypothetical protein P154DRAFT_622129 [Amniculicola lignicola CBS 123094]